MAVLRGVTSPRPPRRVSGVVRAARRIIASITAGGVAWRPLPGALPRGGARVGRPGACPMRSLGLLLTFATLTQVPPVAAGGDPPPPPLAYRGYYFTFPRMPTYGLD